MDMKEKLYTYTELELIAMRHGVNCVQTVRDGGYEMPSVDLAIEQIEKEIADHAFNQENNSGKTSTRGQRAATYSKGWEG